MAKAKKQEEEKEQEQVYYVASTDVLEPEIEVFPELTAEDAINYVKENEPDMKEIYLYEVKLVGKYKVTYNLEKVI
jgi:hypothetical protein